MSVNLIITDCHDLEMMIFASGALDDVLSELASRDKIQALARPIREILLAAGTKIGILRWLCTKPGIQLNIEMRDCDIFDLVDKSSLEISWEMVVKKARSRCAACPISDSELRAKLDDLESLKPDPLQVCCGRDMVMLLSIGLHHLFGKYRRGYGYQYRNIEAALRLAYTAQHFASTLMSATMHEWESANPSFPLFL